jgi:flagellar hook-basal body complex protein FliE
MAANLARDFAATLQEAETTAKAAMTGEADPHALVQALAQTELAVETAVTVRDKVVEAYQEILRMPV